jgi:hypothetical protein
VQRFWDWGDGVLYFSGMIKERTKPKFLDINLPLSQFIHHKSHMDYSGIEPERLP